MLFRSERLARGCAWAYGAMPSGIMPEVSMLVPCETADLARCDWDEGRWEEEGGGSTLPRGFHSVRDPRYVLRPEAIESLFVLYRVTGEREWQDLAWAMFEAIKNATEVGSGYAAVEDVMVVPPKKLDSMEVCGVPGKVREVEGVLTSDAEFLDSRDAEVPLSHLLGAGVDQSG